MKEENNNNVNEQQATIEERQKVMTIYNKIIAIADKITDDYNDADVTPNHELLAIGVFLRRMESSLTDKDAIRKDGKPWGDQTPGSTEEPIYASMLDVIQKGYEIGQMTECQIPKDPEQTPEDNGK